MKSLRAYLAATAALATLTGSGRAGAEWKELGPSAIALASAFIRPSACSTCASRARYAPTTAVIVSPEIRDCPVYATMHRRSSDDLTAGESGSRRKIGS